MEDQVHRAPRERKRWMVVTAAVLVVGLGASLVGGALWRSSVQRGERDTFNETASDVTATLDTLLQRDADFVTTLRAVLTVQPHMRTAGFQRWFADLQGPQRLAGGRGAIFVERVGARSLAPFLARRNSEPTFRALVRRSIEPVAPVGPGPYCLLAGGSVQPGLELALARVLQGDWCRHSSPVGGSQAALLQAQTDAGQMLVAPAVGQGVNTIVFEMAFYRRGMPIATLPQRRAAVAGWVLTSFDIPTIMRLALGGHRGLRISLYHRNPGREMTLVHRLGALTARNTVSHTRALQIEGPWEARVSGTIAATGTSATVRGLMVLGGGSIVTFLLAALTLVLMRSRERALDLVRMKTSELRHQALHDSLTGLPNRLLALDRAEQMLARAHRQHLPVAVLYVDIDGFKGVNDTFGHAAGDELLQAVAERLLTVVRDGDTAARLGGDEFVVLLEGATLSEGAERVAERLLEALRLPYEIDDAPKRGLTFTASVGIAVGARDSADELLRDADLALYAAKAAGCNRYVMFESAMQTSSHERLTLEMDLLEALEQEQFFLLYQPIFDLRSRTLTGIEALIRWRHPTRGTLTPDKFIPIAERSGLVVPIGRWVLGEACREAGRWHEHGYAVDVAVNVSARRARRRCACRGRRRRASPEWSAVKRADP